MNGNNLNFDWGDTVTVLCSAPQHFKPGLSGCICGIRFIDTDELAFQYGQAVGSELYIVEFDNGEAIEIPRAFLTLQKY